MERKKPTKAIKRLESCACTSADDRISKAVTNNHGSHSEQPHRCLYMEVTHVCIQCKLQNRVVKPYT